MKIIKYPDGTSYAKIEIAGEYEIPTISNFTYKINSYEDLWHLNQIVDVYNHLNMYPTITIPNLIDAQADKRFNKDESSGLKLVCKFLNNMKANFKIFHPHNAEVVEALMDNVEIIDNSEFIARVIAYQITNCSYDNGTPRAWDDRKGKDNLSSVDRYNNLLLMSSDAGGFKPLMKLCDKIRWTGKTASASKSREYKDGKSILNQLIAETDFEGKDILIVDDICIYGRTFKGLATMLRERNCGKLYLAVSHITVQNHEKDNVFNYFDRIFTTNSKYDVYYERIDGSSGKEIKNLEIIRLF